MAENTKKYLDENGLIRFLANIIDKFSSKDHEHVLADVTDVTATAKEVNVLDGITATTAELNYMDGVTSNVQSQIDSLSSTKANKTDLTSGTVTVKEAEHATSADTATKADTATNADHAETADSATKADTATNATNAEHAETADEATHATSADSATTAATSTKATQDGSGNIITSTYETIASADAREDELKELISGKADASHTHTIANITNLQSTLDSKASSSHSHSAATTTAAGFMSAADKEKLDGIAAGANNYTYTLPSAGSSLGGVKSGGDVTISAGTITVNDDSHNHVISNVDGLQSALDGKAAASHTHDDLYYTEAEIDTKVDALEESISGKAASGHTHSAATTSADGFMSASDKSKLDGIATGANKTTVDSSLSSTSTNPVQNKVVNSALSGKVPTSRTVNGKALSANVTLSASDVGAAASSHTHDDRYYTEEEIDAKIDAIVGEGAAETLDTIGEISAAITENQGMLDTLNSAIGSKQATITGGASTITSSNLTASRALVSDGNGKVAVSAVTSTELGYLDGVTSAIQTQLNNKAAASHTHDYAASSHSHAISDVTNLQSELDSLQSAVDGKAASSHSHTITASASDDDVVVLTGTNGTNKVTYSASHANSGVTAGTYKSVTVNEKGHVTGGTNPTTLAGYGITDAAAKSHTHSDYVNQNAFSNVVVGSTTIAADSATDTLTLVAGSNVTLTTSATNDSVTIAATDTVYTHPTTAGNKHIPSGGSSGQILRWSADGTAAWGADNNTTYSAATQSAAGLMSAADKTKLDGIATGANNYTYTLPAATSSALGGVKVGSNITNSSGTISLTKANVTAALGYTPPTSDTNTTYSAGTGISLSGTTFSNSGVRSISSGSTNGTISVNTAGTSAEVAVKGLGSAAYTASSAYAAASHTHNYAASTSAGGAAISMSAVTTAGTGAAYTATVSGITALTAGVSFIMNPHTNSTTTTPTLNVNSLGAKGLRMRGSTATGTAMTAAITAWLASGRPVQVTYNGIYWLAEVTRPSASDLSGTVAVANGGTGATDAATARTNLGAAASDVITVSSTEPTSSTCMLWVQV